MGSRGKKKNIIELMVFNRIFSAAAMKKKPLNLQLAITVIYYKLITIITISLSLFNWIIVMLCIRTELFAVHARKVRDRFSRSVYFKRTRITPLQTSFGNIWYIFQNLLFIIIILQARKKKSIAWKTSRAPHPIVMRLFMVSSQSHIGII